MYSTVVQHLLALTMEHPPADSLSVFPPELYLMILEVLKLPDISGRASHAIYNLARCSRSMRALVEDWGSSLTNDKLERIVQTEQRADFPLGKKSRSGLSVLCAGLAGFCEFCCKLKRVYGLFVNRLQICEICHAVLNPSISRERLEAFYTQSETANDRNVLDRIQRKHILIEEVLSGAFYSWRDIEELVRNGVLILKPETTNPQTPGFYAEEYGLWELFEESWHPNKYYWPRKVSLNRFKREWDYSPKTMHISLAELRPLTAEMRLLDQFRQRFDPNWERPCGSDKDSVIGYGKIATTWIRFGWDDRPWQIEKRPKQPRCLVTTPYATPHEKEQSMKEIQNYVSYCTRHRAVIRAYPDILCDPRAWQLATGSRSASDAVRIAREVKCWAQAESSASNVNFILAKKVGKDDCEVSLQTDVVGLWDDEWMVDIVRSDGTCVNMDVV
jgi:hypothetical protein